MTVYVDFCPLCGWRDKATEERAWEDKLLTHARIAAYCPQCGHDTRMEEYMEPATKIETISTSVTEVHIKRSPYPDVTNPLNVTITGSSWRMSFSTTDDKLVQRINEIATAMESVK